MTIRSTDYRLWNECILFNRHLFLFNECLFLFNGLAFRLWLGSICFCSTDVCVCSTDICFVQTDIRLVQTDICFCSTDICFVQWKQIFVERIGPAIRSADCIQPAGTIGIPCLERKRAIASDVSLIFPYVFFISWNIGRALNGSTSICLV